MKPRSDLSGPPVSGGATARLPAGEKGRVWILGSLLILAGLAAFANSFRGPFIFDDSLAIVDNASIRSLATSFAPPARATVGGRPLLNFSFAVNYALSGENVWSYHALNLLVHLLGGLTLFGVARRTLERRPRHSVSGPGLASEISKRDAGLLAFAIALLWLLHPLQTESVTYIVQRAESLMGLFFLLTLYGFVRSVGPLRGGEAPPPDPRSRPAVSLGQAEGRDIHGRGSAAWSVVSVLACLCGMFTKEVMVCAPVTVLLYDRTFVSGSFVAALRSRRSYYLGLIATWLPLAILVLANGDRGGTSGFRVGVPWWSYYETQFPAVVRYLALSVWPNPLVLDYGTQWVRDFAQVAPSAALVAALAGATAWALWKAPALGFLGFWFFAILAPTSLVPGGRQTMAEHRMYLALVPVVALAVLGIHRVLPRWAPALAVLAAAGCLVLTVRRNALYATDVAIWQDTVIKAPFNCFAHDNFGNALARAGRLQESIAQFQAAVDLRGDFPEAQNNLGVVLGEAGRIDEAVAHYEAALRLKPEFVAAHTNLGAALVTLGRLPEAITHFEAAWRIAPGALEAYNLADALALAGRLGEAIDGYRKALEIDPLYPSARDHLGVALTRAGRYPEALEEFGRILEREPDSIQARYNRAEILRNTGQPEKAVVEMREILRRKPDFAEAHYNLGAILAGKGDLKGAIEEYRSALALKPDFPDAEDSLGVTLAKSGQWDEAIVHFKTELALAPGTTRPHSNLGAVFEALGRTADAQAETDAAARIEAAAKAGKR